MSKMLDDMRKEAAVQGAIKFGRKLNLSDSDIVKELMEDFNLIEEEAQNYMLQESA